MIPRLFCAALALGAAFVATPAAAQSNPDVRCFILSNKYAQAGGSSQAKAAGQMGFLYFLGRIDGRLSDAQLRAAVARESASLNQRPAAAPAEMARCAQQVQAAGKKIQSFSTAAPKR